MTNKKKMHILAMTTILFWALAFPASKIAMKHYNPFSLAFLRVTIASCVLLIIGKATGMRPPKKEDLVWFLLSGACGFGIYLFLFNLGMQTVTSATGSIIIALTPVMTAIGAHHIYRERINIVGWISMAAAFGGVLIMMLWNGILSFNFGMLWVFCSAVLFCIYNLLNRRFASQGYKAIEIVTYSMVASALILSPFSVRGFRELSIAQPKEIITLLVLGAVCSGIAYFLWSLAMSYATYTSEVANYSFTTPFVASILAAIMMGEVPDISTIVGGLVIIVSILVFSFRGKEKI